MREARNDHAEIHRQLLTLSPDERDQMPEVGQSADAVLAKMQAVARNLTDMERSAGHDSPQQVEAEIARLESEANPLDHRASEDRVRRLAYLRRQRRALVEVGRKREEAAGKLEHCRQLLKSMRMELLRYRSGGIGSNPTGLTMVTQQAQGVVREMGYLSDAAAELNAL
jgi:eukaryotic-like serine/threonine-protein kinase